MNETKIPKHMNLTQNQVFGCQQAIQHIDQQDIINAIQFDPSGQLLAIGDNAGRVILFKQQQQQLSSKQQFAYFSEFQSHEPEFDCLKSIYHSESIKQIKWLQCQGKYKKMITNSTNTIKLWKMFEKVQTRVILTGNRQDHHHEVMDIAMPTLSKQKSFTNNLAYSFPHKHNGTINHVDVTKNQQYLFSSDQQKAIMWSFQKPDHPAIVQSTNNKNTWKSTQKITCSKMHPTSDSIFLCGTSKGSVELNDLRISFNNRKNTLFKYQFLENKENDYFVQITSKINSLQFLEGGRYITSRNYNTIKIWDICRPNQPALNSRMCSLFENDCIQDEFQMCGFSESLIATGTYDNKFSLIDPLKQVNSKHSMNYENNAKKSSNQDQKTAYHSSNFNHNHKILACGVHKQSKKLALASLNSFFIFSQSSNILSNSSL